jgi:hypothetical protein
MNMLLLTAAILLTITGLIHSILGEVLIFKKIRRGGIVPNIELPPLQIRNFQIIWATWHLASLLGILVAIFLFDMALTDAARPVVLLIVAFTLFVASFLVLFATKAKHPGWISLLLAGLLCEMV